MLEYRTPNRKKDVHGSNHRHVRLKCGKQGMGLVGAAR